MNQTNSNGDTALMLACANEQEAAAGQLMEATKRAGALDLQGRYARSALHWASAKGLAGTVAPPSQTRRAKRLLGMPATTR